MPPRPNARKWNDVETAIATVAIVTTLGMWNLFAKPAPAKTIQAQGTDLPPTDPPTEAPVANNPAPTGMPQVKIMFTPGATQITTGVQQQVQAQPTKKKHKSSSSSGSSGGTVTKTKSS